MQYLAMFGLGDKGQQTYTGTDEVQFLEITPVGETPDDFFVGQIENLSALEVIVRLRGFRGLMGDIRIRGKESIRVKGCPLKSLSFAVNGTATIRAVGSIIRAENESERNQFLLQSNIIERAPSESAEFNWPDYTHTDISTATTTTIGDPAASKTLRVYKITVAVSAAAVITIQWTDSDGTSNPNIIGSLRFTGENSFVYDFGDNGIECPNGLDGLLRAVSNNTVTVDIDVVSQDV